MKCEKCGSLIRQTLSDKCVSRFGLYKKVAYYCNHCDEIFILEKYRDIIPKNKYEDELVWLRETNPLLNKKD